MTTTLVAPGQAESTADRYKWIALSNTTSAAAAVQAIGAVEGLTAGNGST